jgi:acyl-CoA synthetase (AMP-forming)/AMP-acid ligase II
MMNISQFLARNARKFPNKLAYIDGSNSLTYSEVDNIVNRLASSLSRLHIQPNDKVVLYLPNGLEFVYAYFSVLRLGAIVVPINTRLAKEEVKYILEHSDAKAIIAHHTLSQQLNPLINELDLIWIHTGSNSPPWISLETLINDGSPHLIECNRHDDDDASILYTSGTTGKPKGVLFTHRNILTVANMMAIETNMNKDSRLLHMMPLSHCAPLHLFFIGGLYVGATHVLASQFTPKDFLHLIQLHKITHFFGAPVAYLLTAKQSDIDEYDLSSVKYWLYGGAPLSTQEVQFVQQKFKSDRFMCLYGLTEAGPNGIYLSPEEHRHKAGSIGKHAALHCEAKIVNEKGEEVKVDEIGEILLAGEGTMKGYYKDPVKTAETIRNGWLYTGDLARKDNDGYIWIVDRKKDMIISGGVNIYPKEIEDVLKTHPSISDVAIIGVPHPDWGETAKAFVVTNEHIPNLEEECKRFLEGEVADYKIPRLFETIDELPRNASGKILKQLLRQKEVKA